MLSRLKFTIVISSTFLTALLVIGSIMGPDSSAAEGAYRQLSVYTEVLSKIKSDYVEDPDIKLVTRGALQGLLESLDPLSSYLTAEQFKEYEKRKKSQEGGIGLVVSKRFGIVFVLTALPGSPAAEAGLGVGDQVDAVDGLSTRDLPLPLTQVMLDGPVGSSVKLVIRRNRPAEEPQEITLTRAAVPQPPVNARMLEDKIGYIEVRSLAPGKIAEAAKAIRDLTSQGAERFILDLRNNAIGDPQEGVKLANLFVASGQLAYLEGQKFPRKEFSADPRQAILSKQPVVVLTNRATAGAAEVAAAAIVDRQRGQIVGEKTFGMAAEPKVIPMDDGAALILSVAKYYRPSGKAILDGGVNPTLLVAESNLLDDEDESPAPGQAVPDKSDEVLKKAIEVVKGATGAQAAA